MDYLQYYGLNKVEAEQKCAEVLNLIINGLPSILKASSLTISPVFLVLNLIINWLPSILKLIYLVNY